MPVDDLNPADLDELATALYDADPTHELIRSATLNPDEVQLPGIWIRFDGLGAGTLAGLTVRTTLHLIVPNAGGVARVLGKLAELYNVARPVIAGYGGPSGDVLRTGVLLPSNAAQPMPALAVPLDLLTSQPEE